MMRLFRILRPWSISCGLVLACYHYEGQEHPIWQKRVFVDGNSNYSSHVKFAGFLADGKQFMLVEGNSKSHSLTHYDLASGTLLRKEELPPQSGEEFESAIISGDAGWLVLYYDFRPIITISLLRCERDDSRETRYVNVWPKSFDPGMGDHYSFSADSHWLAFPYEDRMGREVVVADLSTGESAEHYSIPFARYSFFMRDPDWILVQAIDYARDDAKRATALAIRRSTKQILNLGNVYIETGPADPHAVLVLHETTSPLGEEEIVLSKVDLTVDPPLESPLNVSYPKPKNHWLQADDAGNHLISEAGKPSEWLSPSVIPYQKVFLVDVNGHGPLHRRWLPGNEIRQAPTGQYLLSLAHNRGVSTLSVWHTRPPARSWNWLLVSLAVAAMIIWYDRPLLSTKIKSSFYQ